MLHSFLHFDIFYLINDEKKKKKYMGKGEVQSAEITKTRNKKRIVLPSKQRRCLLVDYRHKLPKSFDLMEVIIN